MNGYVTIPDRFRLDKMFVTNLKPQNRCRRVAPACLLFLLFTITGGFSQTLQVVLPSQTDTNITQYNNYHYVYFNSGVTARGQLLVFLPGTGGRPSGCTDVLKTGANLGFHTIGLMYPNGATMNSLCGDSTDPDCYAEVRLAVINGGTNNEITVAGTDSITNRLVKLLQYLVANDPAQNWGQFLTAQSDLIWPKIVICGHSQGAGHAGLIAKVYPVARSVMLSDTDWWTPNGQLPGQPADWISSPGVTPDQFYFGFVHVQDSLIPYAEEIPTWEDYGLAQFGGPLLVESNAVPYWGSHMLTTDLTPQNGLTGLNCHDATAVDTATPLAADGVTPVYQPVWQYMLVGPPELPQMQLLMSAPGQAQIAFATYANYGYQLEVATNISGSWTPSGASVAGDGTTKFIPVNASAALQFYRLRVEY